MKPLFALLVAAVVVIGTAPIGAAAIASPDASSADLGTGPGPAQTTDTAETNTTDADTAESNATETPNGTATDSGANDSNATAIEPGAQLAGVVAVQRTEVESEVGSRAFGQRVAAAASNDSKAAIVAGEVNGSRERLADLHDRLDELEAAREAGNISEGRYRANTAEVAAEINAIERRLEQSNETAASLPADVRAANGINTSDIERLRTEARNLSGPEVAAIARSIGGDRSGRGLGDNVGPPGRSGEASGPTGPPEDRTRNGSDGEGTDRAESNGTAGDRSAGDGPDRRNDQRGSDGGERPQKSEADRESGGSDESGSSNGGAGGPDSNPGNGNGDHNGGGPDTGPSNDASDSGT